MGEARVRTAIERGRGVVAAPRNPAVDTAFYAPPRPRRRAPLDLCGARGPDRELCLMNRGHGEDEQHSDGERQW